MSPPPIYNSPSINIPRTNLPDIIIFRDDNYTPSILDEHAEWISPAIETHHTSFNDVSTSYILTIYDYIQNNYNNITTFIYDSNNNSSGIRPQLSHNHALIAINEIQAFINDKSKIICIYGRTSQSMNHILFRVADTIYAVYFDSNRGIHIIDIVDNNFINYISPIRYSSQYNNYPINTNYASI